MVPGRDNAEDGTYHSTLLSVTAAPVWNEYNFHMFNVRQRCDTGT